MLTTIVYRAVQLAGTDGGPIFEYDEADRGIPPARDVIDEEVVAWPGARGVRKGEGVLGRMAVTREPVQIPDIAAEGAYESRAP